jgi:SAM-dependent methyltransferase
MELEQYAEMFRREERHWWYAGMRRTALALLNHALAGQTALRLLDAGCGTGGTTVHLRQFGDVVGLDLAWEALLPAAERGLNGKLVRGTVEHLPFPNATFDAVTSFEVVYHLGVHDDRRAFAEFRRVLRPGGVLLLRLPAHDWLRGAHDRLVHTRHRYSRAEVAKKLRSSGFRVERLNWANSALFLPAAAKRLLESRFATATGPNDLPISHSPALPLSPDLWQPPGPLNSLLEGIVGFEALAVTRGVPLPFGLSLIALVRAV